jgi:hypothetical protein
MQLLILKTFSLAFYETELKCHNKRTLKLNRRLKGKGEVVPGA